METEYLLAIEKLAHFDAKNAEVLIQREKLLSEVAEAEQYVRELALARGESIDFPSIGIRFTFSQPYEKSVSYTEAVEIIKSTLKGTAKNNTLALLEEMAVVTVDPKVFMESITEGKMPNELRVALKETPKKPIISKRSIK